MILADFGVAFVVVIGLVIFGSIITGINTNGSIRRSPQKRKPRNLNVTWQKSTNRSRR